MPLTSPESPYAPFYPFFWKILFVVCFFTSLIGGVIVFENGHPDCPFGLQALSDVQSITTQLALYKTRHGCLPSNQQGLDDALVNQPNVEPVPANWKQLLPEIPTDPWGNAYAFEVPAQRSRWAFDLYSKGPDRQAGTADDIGNWSFAPR